MGHDEEAGLAAMQIAHKINKDGTICFTQPGNIEAYVSRVKRAWPIPDGLINVTKYDSGNVSGSSKSYPIALEYKRENEGVHGILTAIGQGLSYLKVGFAGAIIVVPNSYNTLNDAGNFALDVVDKTCRNSQIGIFSYERLDVSAHDPNTPLLNLQSHKTLELDNIDCDTNIVNNSKTQSHTQWAFVREGETTPDTIFKWLKNSQISYNNAGIYVNQALRDAVRRLNPNGDPIAYLSNAPNNEHADLLWKQFWFTYVLTRENQKIWVHDGRVYRVNNVPARINQFNGDGMMLFSGKSNSIKNKLVSKLNSDDDDRIDEQTAWMEFATNIHNRAHSFRETLDSGLEAFGFIENDGRPTILGHQFISASEKTTPNSESALLILRYALLKKGMYSVLLHYIYKISEQKFKHKSHEFMEDGTFQKIKYLQYLEKSLESMHVLNKVSLRGGVNRKPLQAERTLMKKLGLVSGEIRPGLGLVINWPRINETIDLGNDAFKT